LAIIRPEYQTLFSGRSIRGARIWQQLRMPPGDMGVCRVRFGRLRLLGLQVEHDEWVGLFLVGWGL
jgi:hypothetical protein